MMDSEDMKVMSRRLSRVLGYIGIYRRVIMKRRRTILEIETMQNIMKTLLDSNGTVYYFGSQSEGTKTPGMQSDVDMLLCMNLFPVILDWSEWGQGTALLVLKSEESPPQHCCLQRVMMDSPEPVLQIFLPSDVIDSAGRVLITNTQVELDQMFKQSSGVRLSFKQGPSKSFSKTLDAVIAFHCDSLPEECKFLLQRSRPGHWPTPNTLAKVMGTGVFLVPQGYTESPSKPTRCRSSALHVIQNDPYYPRSKREWRFSTSMMERLLVFDWNTIQIKVYVMVKIIRKTFFKPIVGDRLSTFHIQTAMLFTIETYPPKIWRKDNIVQCVIYCLTTLRRWLNIKFCPHYTIAGVNLFTGKLFSHEINRIAESITSMIAKNLQCIYQIEMDSLGARMSALSSGVSIGESISRNSSITFLLDLINYYMDCFQSNSRQLNKEHVNLGYRQFKQSVSQFVKTLVHILEQGTAIQQEAAEVLIIPLRNTLASVQASRCIDQGRPITPNILNLYQLSVDSDLLTRRLKFPSMLYCSGQYVAAENYLTNFEALLGPEVYQFCNCEGRIFFVQNNLLWKKALTLSMPSITMLRKHTTFCLQFTRHEMFCIPKFMRFEMFRTITEEDRQQRHPFGVYNWMDMFVVDSDPFFHYLQFLTYWKLNQHRRAKITLLKFSSYIWNNFGLGHIDTTLNMIGHCCELIDMRDKAWMYYGKSLQL